MPKAGFAGSAGGNLRLNAKMFAAATIGYALLLIFFVLFTCRINLLFFGSQGIGIFSAYAHAAEMGQVGCMFLLAAAAYFNSSATERIAPYIALALLVCGYALTLDMVLERNPQQVLPYVAGTVFGCGWSACFLCWTSVLSRMVDDDSTRVLISATVLAGFFVLGMSWIPTTVALFSILSVVIASCCALLFFCLYAIPALAEPFPGKGEHERSSFAQNENEMRKSYRARFVNWVFVHRQSLLCVGAISFACGAQRVVSLEGFLPQDMAQGLSAVGYFGGTFLFFLIQKTGIGKLSAYGVYTALLLVMATDVALTPLQNESVQAALYGVDLVCFSTVSMCVVATVLRAIRRVWQNPLFVGGAVCGMMYCSIQVGRIVCNAILELFGLNAFGIAAVSIVISYVVVFVVLSSNLFFRLVKRSSAFRKEPDGGGADASTSDQSRVVVSVANITEDQLRENPVYRRQYKLTEREIDTAIFLLAGYNSADIAKMLVISQNTVKTHLKNLYAKMGVHNRRELIDALNTIEALRAGEEGADQGGETP